MTVNRSVITTVFMLVTYVIVLVHTKDAPLEYDDPTANETARHRDTESTIGDHRQDRVSLPASSKAKREQALRSILTARRRQILSQRPVESRTRAPRPIEASKESDVLEAQETRHYVTAANIKDDEDGKKEPAKEISESNSQQTIEKPGNATNEGKLTSNLKINSTISTFLNTQKSSDSETRKKKIVPMPESLYNYFRPVESNIPVEDMSQFLYFGQKIQPESQNGTGNNSVEASSMQTTASSRRRYSMKRFTSTTPALQSEEIINEEMNIAVERQTVEKNKVSTMKNVFRSPENGLHYRKKSTETSNVITNEAGNRTGIHDNSSAHAEKQLHRVAHVETGNSTQIPQPINQTESENFDESKILNQTKTSTNQKRSDDLKPTVDSNPELTDKETSDEQTEKIRRIDMYDMSKPGSSRESNNIETSTSREKSRASTEPFRIIWTPPETSTLRIIVTEGTLDRFDGDSRPVKPADPLEEGVRVAPKPAPQRYSDKTFGNEDPHRHREQQQQHVYAYTITNVTRLLRNYTGPGLSRVGQGGLSSASEITSGPSDPRRPSPTEIPAAGSGTEVSRGATAGFSAGTTVERDADGGSPGARQVGERARKVVTVAGGQSQQRAGAGRTSQQLTAVNKDGPRPARAQELSHRGTVRWNHTRTSDLEGFGDRRILRKSASAVLNQRASTEEEASQVKRRRLTNVARRVKGKSIDSAMRSFGDKNSTDDEDRSFSVDMNSTVSTVPSYEENSTMNVTEEDVTDDVTSVTEAISESVYNDTKESAADSAGSGEPAVAVTVTEPIAPKQTTTAATSKEMTTIPAPVFPVTPKIAEPVQSVANQTFTSDSGNLTETVKNGAEKRVGLSNMDPSEIQKMYRAKDATTTTTTTTAATSDEDSRTTDTTPVQIEMSTTPQDKSATDLPETRPEASTDSSMESRKKGERSPEVRGRNLSDKSQDLPEKDDVLPIMHLYNTSNIFNGTGPVNSISRGTERRTELPVITNTKTTERVNNTVNESVPRNHDSSNSTRIPETRRQEDNRNDTSTQVPPTGPGRGSPGNRTRHRPAYHHAVLPEYNSSVYSAELNRTFFEAGLISVSPRESVNISEVISKRHDGDAIASQETVAVVSYILATLLVFPIAVGVGLILRRLILRNRKVLEESDTSSEISCRKDALNLENGDFKTSIEKAITKLPRIQHLCHEAEKPPPPSSQESRWEFPRDKLRLQTVLGQGNFGQVWKAEADDLTGHQGTTRLVAVKTVKEGASDREKEDLVRELEIMQQLGSHPNVVTLLGCCTEQEPHYLILEYVMYGKLLAYLRDHRTRQDFYNFSEDSAALTSRDLTVFAYCVARGMEYLASKKIIHRDLAARNVLVDHNKLCKIADFGMSRFANEDGEVIETRHGRNALPIRWMAPESLIYSLFTTKTDVWSFGILMWEIVTLGSTPYPDMTAREVMRNVQNGYRLERPSHCRSELFRVISRCWHADPDRRSEFQALRRDLAQLLEDNMNGHYVDLESFASESTD